MPTSTVVTRRRLSRGVEKFLPSSAPRGRGCVSYDLALIRLLDFRGVGQPLAYYAGELRRRRWKDAIICLPHDGVATNNITGKRSRRKGQRVELAIAKALEANGLAAEPAPHCR